MFLQYRYLWCVPVCKPILVFVLLQIFVDKNRTYLTLTIFLSLSLYTLLFMAEIKSCRAQNDISATSCLSVNLPRLIILLWGSSGICVLFRFTRLKRILLKYRKMKTSYILNISISYITNILTYIKFKTCPGKNFRAPKSSG